MFQKSIFSTRARDHFGAIWAQTPFFMYLYIWVHQSGHLQHGVVLASFTFAMIFFGIYNKTPLLLFQGIIWSLQLIFQKVESSDAKDQTSAAGIMKLKVSRTHRACCFPIKHDFFENHQIKRKRSKSISTTDDQIRVTPYKLWKYGKSNAMQ